MKDYVALDVKNPNSRGNTICAIGIAVVRDGQVTDRMHSTIDPEDRVDPRNVSGHEAGMISGSPKLPEFWPKIKDLLQRNVIVSHNAKYCLSVLSRSLDRYGIEAPEFRYVCTLRLSRKLMDAPSYRIQDLSATIGHPYEGSQPLAGAEASHALFQYLEGRYGFEEAEIQTYKYGTEEAKSDELVARLNEIYGIVAGISADRNLSKDEIRCILRWINNNMELRAYPLFDRIITALDRILEDGMVSAYEQKDLISIAETIGKNRFYNDSTVAIEFLHGIIRGISADGEISRPEGMYLKKWLEDNSYLAGIYPYDKIYAAITKSLSDSRITPDEQQALLKEFEEVLGDDKELNRIVFEGKTFCLAGDFEHGSTSKIKRMIEAKGGISRSRVDPDLDYLFVGGRGMRNLLFGGEEKIAMAEELRDSGSGIRIVGEKDLFMYL